MFFLPCVCDLLTVMGLTLKILAAKCICEINALSPVIINNKIKYFSLPQIFHDNILCDGTFPLCFQVSLLGMIYYDPVPNFKKSSVYK
jgi:hypothetical protein